MSQYDTIAQLHSHGLTVDQIIKKTGFKASTVKRSLYDIERGGLLKRRRSHHPGKYTPLPDAVRLPTLHLRPRYPDLHFGPPAEFREMLRVNIGTGGVRVDRRREVIPWLTDTTSP